MAHRLLRDPDADGWERADFPIVCETCLGPNPYVRMQRMEFGGECHISGRPYTKFRWRPGNDARYKGTIICQEVAKAKNVCQVCLLDLDYNLPVQVRDQALGIEDEALPESDVGREFALERMSNEGELGAAFQKGKPNDTILKLQRTNPYYQRNKAQICSFFVKGECKRGAECPYRHEMPTTGELAQQNIKDRYFGVNDPVAKKMMNRAANLPDLEPPEDKSITTLYIGSVTPDITEDDLGSAFAPFGEVTKVKKVDARHCAFVTFAERSEAEQAASKLHNKLIVKGSRLRLMWGRPQERQGAPPLPHQIAHQPVPVAARPPPGGPQPPSSAPNFFNVSTAVQSNPAAYASMDPQQQGTRVPEESQKRKQDGGPATESKRQAGGPQSTVQQNPPGGYMQPPPGQFAQPHPGFRPMGPPQPYPGAYMPRPGFPPPGMRPGMFVPGQGPPPGWRPPPGAPRPPVSARPAAAQQ